MNDGITELHQETANINEPRGIDLPPNSPENITAVRLQNGLNNGTDPEDLMKKLIEEEVPSESKQQPENEFHRRIANRVNEWLSTIGNYHRKMIYFPENITDWSSADPTEYFLHKITVIGLPDGCREVTPAQIDQILKTYREAFNRSGKIETIRSAYEDFKKDSSLGIGGEFFPENLFLLPHSRIVEITDNDSHLAVTLDYTDSPIKDVLISIDDETLSDPNNLYDVVVHELGHQARKALKLDENADPYLEEGIVQANATRIETKHDRLSDRSKLVYHFERLIAEKLGEKLGVDLFQLSHNQIREKMREIYSYLNLMNDPYDELTLDMFDYRETFNDFAQRRDTNENITVSDLNQMKEKLRDIMIRIFTLWDL